MEAAAHDFFGPFLEEGQAFLKTWERLILTFGSHGHAAHDTALYECIGRLREACLAAGLYELGVMARVMEAMTLDILRGVLAKNDELRHLLIDFHGVVERWLKTLTHNEEPKESSQDILNQMLARVRSVPQTLEHENPAELSPILGMHASASESASDQGCWVPQKTISTMDYELNHIWSQLLSLEHLLQSRSLSRDDGDILADLQARVRYTKDTIRRISGFSTVGELCDALIVESGSKIFAIPLVDIDGILDLRKEGENLNQPKRHESHDLEFISYRDKCFPLIALAQSLNRSTPRSSDLGVQTVAILAYLARGPAALTLDKIRQRSTILMRPLPDKPGSRSVYKGTTLLSPGRWCPVLNLKNLIIG